MDFAQTRQENDASLLSRIDAIRQGEDLAVLEPFAKAYLGLFYDVDNRVPPAERLDLLANPALSDAIKQGLLALLQRTDLPAPEAIARAMLQQEVLPIGYGVLAGVALTQSADPAGVAALPERAIQAAICFHHALQTFHADSWYESLLLQQPDLAANTLLAIWQVLIAEQQHFLPGLQTILKKPDLLPLFRRIVVPLLVMWRQCRQRELYQLLSMALQHVEAPVLLAAAQAVLADSQQQLGLRNQVYWHGTAFLLAPELHGQAMLNYMGQEKIKLLPLLDFIIPLLEGSSGRAFTLSAEGYACLIRCLAQKFTPQIDMYGNLSDVTLKVLWLFYRLACFSTRDGAGALNGLRRVRVLRLYTDIFDAVAAFQARQDKADFPAFVQALQEEGRLRMKKNWHDVH